MNIHGSCEPMKWAEFDAGDITFAVKDPTAFDPGLTARVGGKCLAFAVEDLEGAVAELEGKGPPVIFAVQETPVCHFACGTDPDGNQVWLRRRKDGTFAD